MLATCAQLAVSRSCEDQEEEEEGEEENLSNNYSLVHIEKGG